TYKVDEIRASHILFDKKDKAKAEEVLAKLQAGGSFEDMAKQYGTDGTKDNGGDLGYFGKGKMVEPFEKAAFALEKGQMSELVETEFGWHIIKVTDKKEYKPYEEVEASIKNELTTPDFDKKIKKMTDEIGVTYLTDMKPGAPAAK
ncbi:MAG: peptidylprolyl isomerase, partial [Anaerovorax sp.]